MKVAIDIIHALLLPKLEKDSRFDAKNIKTTFWADFTKGILDLETNAQPLYALIYSLQLQDAEKIISTLDSIYIDLVKELAELHVLGTSSEAIEYLITSKNKTFEKEVSFYTDLKNAITNVERKRIKQELPNAYERLSFELSDDAIAMAIRKKERETLKEKMKAWDQELAHSETTPVYSIAPKKETKVIYLSWIKYAVAACFVLGLGVWFYNFQTQGTLPQNNVVTAPEKKDTLSSPTQIPEIPSEALAEVTTVTKTTTVIQSGLGYATTSPKIQIIENNQGARKMSIVKAIEEYRKILEDELQGHVTAGTGPRAKAIEDTIASLQKELALLNEKEKQYVFNGKELVLFVSITAKENAIVLYEETLYLKRNTDFFKLTVAKQPQLYKKETNSEILKALDKIYNGY